LPQLGDFLSRFRPAGAPGAASRAGVPADRAAELSAELDPVLALLAAADADCGRLAAEAEQEAGRLAAQGRDQAASIAADAVQRADQARGRVAAEVLAAAGEQARQAQLAAAEQARRRSGPSEEDVQALIAAAIDLVWSMPGGDEPGGSGRR
jgi:hypothetical protein